MEFHLPELGEGVYEAELSRWLIKEGESVRPGQGLLEVLTDKATMEVPAPFFGTIDALLVKEGQQVKVGAVMLTYQEVTAGAKTAAPAHVSSAAVHAIAVAPVTKSDRGNGSLEHVSAAPSVRAMARKLGIDLAKVKGSGPGGRILIEDLPASVPASPHAPSSGIASPERPNYGTPGTRIKLQGLRRRIAEHMVHAKHTIPHYTYVDETDVSDLVKIRTALRAANKPEGIKITFLPFFVKAVIHALREVPLVNSSLDEGAGDIVLHDKIHIGIAVATPGGLIVPVVHDAAEMSVLELARKIDRLTNDARAGKSKREDLIGGTFTVTSIGNIGGLFATPIIHHPQVGILGIGKIVKRPVYSDKSELVSADMVYLSFSFDHRVLDGAVGAAFGNAVIERLKKPAALLVE